MSFMIFSNTTKIVNGTLCLNSLRELFIHNSQPNKLQLSPAEVFDYEAMLLKFFVSGNKNGLYQTTWPNIYSLVTKIAFLSSSICINT